MTSRCQAPTNVGRTLLSVAFDLDFDFAFGPCRAASETGKSKVKTDGQECPSHIIWLIQMARARARDSLPGSSPALGGLGFWRMYSSFPAKLSCDRSTWSNDSSRQTGPQEPESLLTLRGRSSLECFEDGWHAARPALFVTQRRQEQMHVLGHHHSSVKLVAFPAIVQAVLKHGMAGLRCERIASVLAKRNEKPSSRELVVRQLAAVFIHSFQRYVGRTLLSVAFDFDLHIAYCIRRWCSCL